jgi:hypothetical protein
MRSSQWTATWYTSKTLEGMQSLVVALRAPSNRLADTRPLMPALLALLPLIKPGTVTFLPQAA